MNSVRVWFKIASGTTQSDASMDPFEAREKALAALAKGQKAKAVKFLRAAAEGFSVSGAHKEEAECRFGLARIHASPVFRCTQKALEEGLEAARCAARAGDRSLFDKALAIAIEAAKDKADLEKILALLEDPALSEDMRECLVRASTLAKTAMEVEGSAAHDDAIWTVITEQEAWKRLLQSQDLGQGYSYVLDAERAFVSGSMGTAEDLAQKARQEALEKVDPALYVIACGLIGRIREARGDKIGALTILFTCRASLVDLLGEEAGRQVDLMIEALRHKWGEEEFQRTLELYRKQFD